MLLGRGQQARRILGRADHLDTVGHGQEGANAFPDEDVIVPQNYADRCHADIWSCRCALYSIIRVWPFE